jgi:hypothetical protein
VEDSQDAREEVLLPAYRVTGKPEVNFSIADAKRRAKNYRSSPSRICACTSIGEAVLDFRFDPYWAEAWLSKSRRVQERAPELRAMLSKVPC